jgi:hypothetical protein
MVPRIRIRGYGTAANVKDPEHCKNFYHLSFKRVTDVRFTQPGIPAAVTPAAEGIEQIQFVNLDGEVVQFVPPPPPPPPPVLGKGVTWNR